MSHKPSLVRGRSEPVAWSENNGSYFMFTPGNSGDPFPYNALALTIPITGFGPGAGPGPANHPNHLVIRNAANGFCFQAQSSAGIVLMNVCDSGTSITSSLIDQQAGGQAAMSGFLRMRTGGGITWRNVANTGDALLGHDQTSDFLFYTGSIHANGTLAACNVGGSRCSSIQENGTAAVTLTTPAVSGTLTVAAGVPTVGRATCWKTATTIGSCSTAPAGDGSCTCN